MNLTPNVKRLVLERAATITVQRSKGSESAISGVIERLLDRSFLADLREANDWAAAAIDAVRHAGEPNPWRCATDEEIAAEVLKRVEARKALSLQPRAVTDQSA
jgi:hypothetical protein